MKLSVLHELALSRVVEGWKRGSIARNPEYQRGRAWSTDQQRMLVDSALRGYPLPRFYFSAQNTTDPLGNQANTFEVIDGLQRIVAFTDFLEDRWELLDPTANRGRFPRAVADAPAPWAGCRFSELAPEDQQRLLDLQLPVVIVESFDSPDELRDLFIRLQAGTALTRQQIRDAWPGAMSEYIERIAGKLSRRGRFPFLSSLDRRGSRRDDEDELDDQFHDGRQTAAQLMRLFLDRKRGSGIGSVGVRALDDLYHSETDFDGRGELAAEFERVLRYVEFVVDDRAPRTTGGSKAKVQKLRLFGLFLALADLSASPNLRVDRELEKVAAAFWNADWRRASADMRVGKITSRGTIAAHARWFLDEVVASAGLAALDPRRTFAPADREAIWAKSGGACGLCGEPLSVADCEFDHIVAWIKGGPTSVENGRAVHRTCNRRQGEGRDEVAA